MGKRKRHRYPDLKTYLEKSGDTQVKLSRVLQVPQATLSRIAAGQFVPRPELAWRLSEHCEIPLESFTLAALARQGIKVAS